MKKIKNLKYNYMETNTSTQSIQDILEKNKVEDLKKFLERRQRLNSCNSSMIYLFHIVQSVGILASSYSASSGDPRFLWAGIGLNMCASIIQIYEKINSDQMKRIYMDIQSIKNNTYLDESQYIEMESGTKSNTGAVSGSSPSLVQTGEN
jgi:hypothetical protein